MQWQIYDCARNQQSCKRFSGVFYSSEKYGHSTSAATNGENPRILGSEAPVQCEHDHMVCGNRVHCLIEIWFDHLLYGVFSKQQFQNKFDHKFPGVKENQFACLCTRSDEVTDVTWKNMKLEKVYFLILHDLIMKYKWYSTSVPMLMDTRVQARIF